MVVPSNSSRCLLVALLCLGAACADAPLPEWQETDGIRWRALVVDGGDPGFTRLSGSRTGIAFSNELDPTVSREHDHLQIGSGVAIGDVDGDGLADVYLARLEGDNALYRNLGGLRFEDVTQAAGVAAAGRYSTGASFADVDGDGDLDLFVTALGGPNALYTNDGAGVFTERTEAAGLNSHLGSTTATWADVDGDGDLDLYVANYKVESAADELRPYERPTAMLDETGDSVFLKPEFSGHFRLENTPDGPKAVEQADPDRLYLNDGTGRFTPVSWTEGAFLDAEGRPLDRDLDDFGLAARFFDVDGDRDPDLYVANDFDDPDQLWLNDGRGAFRAAPWYALRTTSNASMSIDFADIDRDGHVDFFVADMLSRDPGRRLRQRPLHTTRAKLPGETRDRPQCQRNTLFRNRGDGTFAQIAEYAGVDASEWTWASLFLDVDLDGFEDLLVANGHGRDMQDGDALARIAAGQGNMTWLEAKAFYPELETPNVAFRNRGDLTFEEVGTEWGFAVEPDVSHGMAFGDLDGDGDHDVVVNRLSREALVLRNEAGGDRIAVRLRGTGLNTAAIGASVRLAISGLPEQAREVTAGGLYLSGAESALVFAAREGSDHRLMIEWPSGAVTDMPVEANRLYEVSEQTARARPEGGGAEASDRDSGPPNALFEDASDLIPHAHAENDFDDFRRQALVPYRWSRLGPGLAWGDVDADGDPDLVVGAATGQAATLLRNDGAGFTAADLGGPAAYDLTAVVVARLAEGPPSVLAGQANLEATSIEAVTGAIAVLGVGPDGREETVVSGAPSTTGPIALADVDGDGDLDLFVGGRGLPGLYPLPADSRVMENRDGTFIARADAAGMEDLGLVSGAAFSDLDADGDPDLLLAVEWGTPRVFENDGGRLRDATEAWGLSGLTGRWNGIAAGDFDGDGLPDAIVTNQGRNVRVRPEPGRPLRIYHGDVDRNGSWDVFRVQPDEDGVVRGLDRFERLRRAMPSLISRVDSFRTFSEASPEDVMGVTSGYGVLEATVFEHLLLLNRGGRFETGPLPVAAQLAPAMGVVVADFDGDGAEDAFLGQGFFPTEEFSPRYDAGIGLVLRGDGEGGLEPLGPVASGLRVFGDMRGVAVADYDSDGRADIAIGQNGEATRLFRNVGAEPGLRVRLIGPPANPDAIGAAVRVLYADGEGPVREVTAGSGYWSSNDPVLTLGLRGEPRAVRVRWPGGAVTTEDLAQGTRDVTIRAPRP